MLEAIRNQPINFLRIIESETCNEDCGDRKEQCLVLTKTKDWLSFQMRNPAFNELDSTGWCDAETLIYFNTLDATGSGDIFSPSGMTWDSVNEKFDKAPGGTSALGTTLNLIAAGKTYKIRALISNYSAGLIRFSDIGPSSSAYFSADGWQEFIWTSVGGNEMFIEGDSASQFSIDEFEIYEIAAGLTIGASWTVIPSDTPNGCGIKLTHYPASSNSILSNYPISANIRYRINFRITGMTAGSLTLQIGDYTESFSANGYYTRWITPSASGQFAFYPTVDFDGAIEVLQFGQQPNRHAIIMNDLQGNFVADFSQWSGPARDWFTFNARLTDATLAGCFKLCVYDFINIFGQSGDILQGKFEFDTTVGWALVDDVTISNGLMLVKEGGTADFNIGAGTLINNGCYIMEIKFRNYSSTTAAPDQFKILFDGHIIYSNPAISPSNAGVFQIPFTWSFGSFSGAVQFVSEYGAGNDLEIEYVRIFLDPACGSLPGDPSFCSQCITILDPSSTDCQMKQVTGNMDSYTDEFGTTSYKTAFGFYWEPFFQPLLRVKAEFHTPKFPADIESFLDNVGTRYNTGSVLEKEWSFAIAAITEAEQNALRMMIRTDSIGVHSDDILNDPDAGDFYFCPSKEISGAWPKKEKPSTSDIEVDLQRRFEDGISNRNII